MSNKLTNENLKQLIREILKESKKDKLKTLAAAKKEWEDFYAEEIGNAFDDAAEAKDDFFDTYDMSAQIKKDMEAYISGGSKKTSKKTTKKTKKTTAATGDPTKINTYANKSQQRRDIRSITKKTTLDPKNLKLNSTKLSAANKITILKILIKPGLQTQVAGNGADEPKNHQDWTKAVRDWAAKTLEEYVNSPDQAIKRAALLAKKSVGLKVDASSFTAGLTPFSIPLGNLFDALTASDPAIEKAVQKAWKNDKNAIQAFAGLAENNILNEDTSMVDLDDFAVALMDKSSPHHKKAIQAIKIINNLSATSPEAKALVSLYTTFMSGAEVLGKGTDPTTSSGRGATSDPSASELIDLGDIYGRERKNVPQYIVDVFSGLKLETMPSLKSRVEALNKLSENMLDSTKTVEGTIGEKISGLAVLEVFTKLLRSFDAQAAGWVFESFLAQLGEGAVVGGALGADDFSFGLPPDQLDPTRKGSAKLLNKTEFSQSGITLNKALKNVGDSMVYIVGVKRGFKDGKTSGSMVGAGTATKGQIAQVDIYVGKISRIANNTTTSRSGADVLLDTSLSGEGITVKGMDGATGVAFEATGTPIVLKIATDQQKFKAAAEKVMKDIDDKLPVLTKTMGKFSRETTSFLSAGRKQSAVGALQSYSELFGLINQVFGVVGAETGVEAAGGFLKGTAATVGLTENKTKSLKDLDKLIERVILENMNKK